MSTENRLPKHVLPTNYRLTISPDLKSSNFAGELIIDIEVLEPCDRIVLNAKQLEIERAELRKEDGTSLEGTVFENPQAETIEIRVKGILGPGQWQVYLAYRAKINQQLKGFYRSTWIDQEGRKHHIGTTHFEPTHARLAFPCFDEPSFKARFKIIMRIPATDQAISNEPIEHESLIEDGRFKQIEFYQTMLLPTYLVAFITGDLEASEIVDSQGTRLRVWNTPGKSSLGIFALKAAVFALEFYENYFAIAYPTEKIDLVALPDFPIGAMENMGCVTFREDALLIDETRAAYKDKKRVAEIVMHELAHMWFGNLVTMDWWNGLWLKESFATFMSHLCLDQWQPEWHVWDEFCLSRSQAMETDSLHSTHAIECVVDSPAQATEMFDIISYEKGCSVLYQLHEYLGPEIFRAGCGQYLKKHSYANTQTHDLWDAMEEACREANMPTSRLSVRDLMDRWVFKPGHPIVAVKMSDTPGCIDTSMSRFCLLEKAEEKELLPVPVIMRSSSARIAGIEKRFLLTESNHTIYATSEFDRVIFNSRGSGFYRVVYEKNLLDILCDDLRSNMDGVERFNLLNDYWAAARAGIVDVGAYLQLLEHFEDESNPDIWNLISRSLKHLLRIAEDNNHQEELRSFAEHLTRNSLNKLGWQPSTSDTLYDRKLRNALFSISGTLAGNAITIDTAQKQFDNWLSGKYEIDSELFTTVVKIIAGKGNQKTYDTLLRLSKEADTPQENKLFLYALADFQDLPLSTRTLHLLKSGQIKSQDAPNILSRLLENETACRLVFPFIKENQDEIVSTYPAIATIRMLAGLSVLDDSIPAFEVRQFFESGDCHFNHAEKAVRQLLESLNINCRFRKSQKVELLRHMEKLKLRT